MSYNFGRFELDEPKRELRLSGVSQPMQPRVFDLLLYLVRNRERVVSKDELLSALWPDVIVTDSSIMRAISLIRTLLREGDQPDAIQTASRQGYRFAADLDDAARPLETPRDVGRARTAYARGDWREALLLFGAIEKPERLLAEDLEQWARAALHLGQPNDSIQPLERAVAVHTQNADRIGAARAALSLTNVNLEARAPAVAKGWHRRAKAFLADEDTETREHGLYLWLASRLALLEGDLSVALDQAKQAEAMARRLEDPDIEALGLVYRCHVELATGEISAGLLHLDEAGAAALSGMVSPWACGIIFCSVIWAYLDRGDIGRAGQWTDQFTRWSKQNQSFGFPGLCRLHRGEVLCVLGNLKEAEAEIHQAREMLAVSARYAEGDACRVLGEIRFLRGDLAGAEESFRVAHELGWHPLPGWALIQAAKGDAAAAIKSLQRGLQFPSWANGQRRGILLAHLAQIGARSGRTALARRALKDLEKSGQLRATPGGEAAYHHARAEVALLEKHPERAIDLLRDALAVWLDAGSRINAAHTRLRLAEMLAGAGDRREAELELGSAEKAFIKMAAAPMVDRCQALRREWGGAAPRF